MGSHDRFTGRADAYASGRPSYPAACVAPLFAGLDLAAGVRAVDLGAGTGISSRLLAGTGATVVAVEPNADMRERAIPMPRVTWSAASAERTGLADKSADLVTAFQAFHWFDPVAALAEMERLLRRPRGRAAVVYNERDESDGFTAAYGAVVRRFATDRTEARRGDGRATFEAHPGWARVSVTCLDHRQSLDRAALHARARSTSYLPTEGVAADRLRTALDDVFGRFAQDGHVATLMKTIVSIGFVT